MEQFIIDDIEDFNPRSPHGERHEFPGALLADAEFQSTLPARGATFCVIISVGARVFQSTLPARGATFTTAELIDEVLISIHAPRTGSDMVGGFIAAKGATFQSTLPARGATRR